MFPRDFSTHGMTSAEVREIAERRHLQALELIRAKSTANIDEIHAKAHATMQVCSHQTGLLTDLFDRQAEREAASESHRTHEYGKRLGLLQHHESQMTVEQAKRHHLTIEASKQVAKEHKALASHMSDEHRKRINHQMTFLEQKAIMDQAGEEHLTQELGKKLNLIEGHAAFLSTEQAQRHQQDVNTVKQIAKAHQRLEAHTTQQHGKRRELDMIAAEAISKQQTTQESHLTDEIRKRINYQIEADQAHVEGQEKLADKKSTFFREKLADALRFQHFSNLLQGQPDHGVIIDEDDSEDENLLALVKRK